MILDLLHVDLNFCNKFFLFNNLMIIFRDDDYHFVAHFRDFTHKFHSITHTIGIQYKLFKNIQLAYCWYTLIYYVYNKYTMNKATKIKKSRFAEVGVESTQGLIRKDLLLGDDF